MGAPWISLDACSLHSERGFLAARRLLNLYRTLSTTPTVPHIHPVSGELSLLDHLRKSPKKQPLWISTAFQYVVTAPGWPNF